MLAVMGLEHNVLVGLVREDEQTERRRIHQGHEYSPRNVPTIGSERIVLHSDTREGGRC
jgi:hypothetical protein